MVLTLIKISPNEHKNLFESENANFSVSGDFNQLIREKLLDHSLANYVTLASSSFNFLMLSRVHLATLKSEFKVFTFRRVLFGGEGDAAKFEFHKIDNIERHHACSASSALSHKSTTLVSLLFYS